MKTTQQTPEWLDIINESDQIIGRATRDEAHRLGLLHREIQVWLYMSSGDLIFQHRSPTKELSPDLLDATCAGHVEHGSGWLDTAVKELQEETGLVVEPQQLQYVTQFHRDSRDPRTGRHNNAIRKVYLYHYTGELADLQPDPAEAVGFETRPLAMMLNLNPDNLKPFSNSIKQPAYQDIFRQIEALVGVPV